MKKNINKFLVLFLIILVFSFLFFLANRKESKNNGVVNKNIEKEKLDISVVTVLEGQESTLFMDLGEDKGFFDKNNINVSWDQVAKGVSTVMISGEADVAFSGATRSILAFSEGADTRIVAIPFKGHTLALSRFPREEASRIKTVALNVLTGEPMMYAHFALESFGVNPEDVEFVTVTDSISRQRMLEEGVVDFVMTRYEFLKELDDPQKYYLITADEYLEDSNLVQGLLTTEKKIIEKPEVLQAFVEAIYEIGSYIVDNPEEIKKYAKEKYSFDDDNAENLSQRIVNMIKMNNFVPEEKIIQDLFEEINNISDANIEKPASEFIYDEFAKEAAGR